MTLHTCDDDDDDDDDNDDKDDAFAKCRCATWVEERNVIVRVSFDFLKEGCKEKNPLKV